MHIILDGYNVIRQSDALRAFERRGLEEARNALLRSLAAYRREKGHRITVVFDGWAGGSPLEERDRFGQVEVVYSRKGETADEVIKRMVQRSGEETVVVTSDREVAAHADRHGASSVSSPEFERILTGLGPDGRDREESLGGRGEDREEDRPAKGKGPSRRPSRRERAWRTRFRKL